MSYCYNITDLGYFYESGNSYASHSRLMDGHQRSKLSCVGSIPTYDVIKNISLLYKLNKR